MTGTMSRSLYAVLALTVAIGASPLTGRAATDIRTIRVPNGGIQPQVARDATGTLHLMYFTGEPAGGNLYYVRSSDDGKTFSSPVRINSQDGSAIATGTIRGGQLALGRDGRIHVAWNGSQQSGPRTQPDPRTGQTGPAMLYSRSNADRTEFEPQRSVMQRSLTLDGGGSLAADGRGNVFVTWHGNDAKVGATGEGNRRLWIARSADDGRTFAPEVEAWNEPTGACSCCGVKAMAGADGTVQILYRSAAANTNRDIYLLTSTDTGRSFRGALVHEWDIAACPMTSMDLADGAAGVLASWESDGQVYFGAVDRQRPGVAWKSAPTPDVTGRKHPRLAVGRDGQILLVWTEGTAWARGGSLAWQLFDRHGQPSSGIERRPGVAVWGFAAAAARRGGGFTVFY